MTGSSFSIDQSANQSGRHNLFNDRHAMKECWAVLDSLLIFVEVSCTSRKGSYTSNKGKRKNGKGRTQKRRRYCYNAMEDGNVQDIKFDYDIEKEVTLIPEPHVRISSNVWECTRMIQTQRCRALLQREQNNLLQQQEQEEQEEKEETLGKYENDKIVMFENIVEKANDKYNTIVIQDVMNNIMNAIVIEARAERKRLRACNVSLQRVITTVIRTDGIRLRKAFALCKKIVLNIIVDSVRIGCHKIKKFTVSI